MIITRAGKGQAITHAELDNNFEELRDRPDGQVYPKTLGVGIKLDTASPDWGWVDLLGITEVALSDLPPEAVVYQGNIKAYQYDIGEYMCWLYHIPHDYVPGTALYVHAHWSHNSSLVTAGSVEFQYEIMYAKGHNQEAFSTPIIVNHTQVASTIRYQHVLDDVPFTSVGGAGGLLDISRIEVDGLVYIYSKIIGNTMTGGAKPFIHCVDIHYQSTGIPTKNRSPSFYG